MFHSKVLQTENLIGIVLLHNIILLVAEMIVDEPEAERLEGIGTPTVMKFICASGILSNFLFETF